MTLIKKPTIGLVAIVTLLVVIWLSQSGNESCQALVSGPATVPQCSASAPLTVSWRNWLLGQSPSFQFHFLDLLELLYGGRR